MKRKVKTIVKEFLNNNPYQSSEDWKTVSLGGGLWGIEYYLNGRFVCEWVGSNGTRDEEADDLHSISTEHYQQALLVYHRIRKLPEPEFVKRNSVNRG